jgi:hypothetical protein
MVNFVFTTVWIGSRLNADFSFHVAADVVTFNHRTRALSKVHTIAKSVLHYVFEDGWIRSTASDKNAIRAIRGYGVVCQQAFGILNANAFSNACARRERRQSGGRDMS